jgi:hypothetical protein
MLPIPRRSRDDHPDHTGQTRTRPDLEHERLRGKPARVVNFAFPEMVVVAQPRDDAWDGK